MKKYITPKVECYEFEAINLCASSPESDLSTPRDDYDGPWGNDIEVLSREKEERNSDVWNSGW